MAAGKPRVLIGADARIIDAFVRATPTLAVRGAVVLERLIRRSARRLAESRAGEQAPLGAPVVPAAAVPDGGPLP